MKSHYSLLLLFLMLAACAPQNAAIPSPTPASTNAPVATADAATPAPIPSLTSTTVAAAIEAPITPQFFPVYLLSATFAPADVIKSPFHWKAEIDEIIPGSHWARLWSTRYGDTWLITDKGVARLSETGWMDYLSDYEGYVVGIESDRVWVVSRAGDSISAWDGTRWKKYSSNDGWVTIHNAQTFELTNPDYPKTSRFTDGVWIATDNDVYRFDGARWTIITLDDLQMSPRATENIPAYSRLKVKVGGELGQTWVGECDLLPASLPTGAGARFFDAASNIWRADDGHFESGCVLVIEEDRKWNLWVAVDYHLWRFSIFYPDFGPVGQGWDNWTPPETPTLTHSYIFNLAVSQTGEPWFLARQCGGSGCDVNTLYHFQNGTWTSFNGFPFSEAREVFLDATDQAWLWALDGLYRIVDNQPQRVPGLIVDDWAIDDAGNIWVVAKNGAGSDKFALWLATP